MEDGLIREIARNIGGANGKFILLDSKKAEIKKENFRQIISSPQQGRIAFIDGGNGEILKAPNFSLGLVRVYYTVYQNNKRERAGKKEFYALATAKNNDGQIVYSIKAFNTEFSFNDFDSYDSTLAQGNHRIAPGTIIEAVRAFAELIAAAELVNELGEGDIIVRDGSLEPAVTGEKKLYDDLLKKAAARGVIVCGLSKSCTLLTDTGNSAIAAVGSIAPGGEWCYKLDEGIFFVKLNKKSSHIFRLDAPDEAMGKLLPLLTENSRDPAFLGYPYSLVEADRNARVIQSEVLYLKTRLKAFISRELEQSINALNAHDILNRIG